MPCLGGFLSCAETTRVRLGKPVHRRGLRFTFGNDGQPDNRLALTGKKDFLAGQGLIDKLGKGCGRFGNADGFHVEVTPISGNLWLL